MPSEVRRSDEEQRIIQPLKQYDLGMQGTSTGELIAHTYFFRGNTRINGMGAGLDAYRTSIEVAIRFRQLRLVVREVVGCSLGQQKHLRICSEGSILPKRAH